MLERTARPTVTFAFFLINLINNLLPHLLFQLHICNEERIWGKDPIKRTQLKPINNEILNIYMLQVSSVKVAAQMTLPFV